MCLCFDGQFADRKRVNDWLEWIKTHGQKSKVIIVANRIEDIPGQSFIFPENQLKQEYPGLIHSFHYISLLRTHENIPEFVKATQQLYDKIISSLLSLESLETTVPQNVYNLKEILRIKNSKESHTLVTIILQHWQTKRVSKAIRNMKLIFSIKQEQ